jgi:hypothetical protein
VGRGAGFIFSRLWVADSLAIAPPAVYSTMNRWTERAISIFRPRIEDVCAVHTEGHSGRAAQPSPTVTLRVAVKNGRKTAIICTFSFATQRISLVSQIGKWDDILRKKLLISYIDQFVVPAKLQ